VWRKTDRIHKGVFRLDHERNVARDRFLFGLSRQYKWGKTLRWHAEKYLSRDPPTKTLVSRNNAMRPPVSAVKMFEHNSEKDTDVIQEFFVPIPQFMTFMEGLRGILQEEETNLLGVTLRYVKANNETALSYAPKENAFAVIVYFNEVCSADGRVQANALINRLVHLAVNCGGTFYLTYARELEMDWLRKAYSEIGAFSKGSMPLIRRIALPADFLSCMGSWHWRRRRQAENKCGCGVGNRTAGSTARLIQQVPYHERTLSPTRTSSRVIEVDVCLVPRN
jgi:hypothetical protein